MDGMIIIMHFVALFFAPILATVFCLNLVAIIKAVHANEPTRKHTFWLTSSFVLIVWSISLLTAYSAN